MVNIQAVSTFMPLINFEKAVWKLRAGPSSLTVVNPVCTRLVLHRQGVGRIRSAPLNFFYLVKIVHIHNVNSFWRNIFRVSTQITWFFSWHLFIFPWQTRLTWPYPGWERGWVSLIFAFASIIYEEDVITWRVLWWIVKVSDCLSTMYQTICWSN